jgi:hypothetical protein
MVILSWVIYIIFVYVVHFSSFYNSVGTMAVAFSSGKFWFNFVLIVGTCWSIDYFTNSFSVLFGNTLSGTLMVLRKQRGTLDNNVDMPVEVEKLLKIYDSYQEEKSEKPINHVDNINVKSANLKDLDKIDRVNME